jgi:hypothetical protein
VFSLAELAGLWESWQMADKIRRHKSDTKTFEELTFNEQVLAMNMTTLLSSTIEGSSTARGKRGQGA